MKQYSSYDLATKIGAIIIDFLMLNLLLSAFYIWGGDIVPSYFREEPSVTFYVANISFIVAEFMFSTAVNFRRISIVNVLTNDFRLVLAQTIFMFVGLRFVCDGGGFFYFMLIFAFSLFIILNVSHDLEVEAQRHYRKRGGNSRNVVFIGCKEMSVRLCDSMINDPSSGYRVLGYYGAPETKRTPKEMTCLGSLEDMDHEIDVIDATPWDEESGYKQIEGVHPLLTTADVYVNLPAAEEKDRINKILKFCERNSKRFYFIPAFYNQNFLGLKRESFGDVTLLTNYNLPLDNPVNRMSKRLFDIVFSSIACLCLLPFIPIIALIIKIQSPGPLFFVQERTGLNGKPFPCYKFRSMHVNKEANTKQATKDDPRKFPFGNFMRKTSIDELPQFFNVFKGDMSVVGPRPHMIAQTEQFSHLIDKYMIRHLSKPGLTGLAQTTGFRGETKELWEMEERVRRDIWYIENWSWQLDLKILLATIKAVFTHKGNAY